MSFSDLLNNYIELLGCSAKELASASGISAAAVSRYRAGERTPDPDSKQLRMLAEGIAKLSEGEFSEQHVHNELAVAINGIAVDYDTYLANVRALLAALSANNNELARALNFDPSYISRILAGQRRPADLQAFTLGVSQFAARRSTLNGTSEALRALIGESWPNAHSEEERSLVIATWLETNYAPPHNPIGSFLERLDAFNLDDFVRAIKFDEMRVPTAPIQLPTTRTYNGIHEMMNCELDFLKAVVLSKSSADVIMYSDMPLEEMAADVEFPKKWMYGMAMLLKKGLRLRMIHDTSRPLSEMMLGLEGWTPMYMTGQIEPYYFDNAQNGVFCHILKVAGTVAMQGEAIAGYHGEGRYVLTKNRDEVRYYRKRAERMLKRARPLMHIITAANAEAFTAFQSDDVQLEGRRRVIMSTPPIGCIPESLLDRVLERHDLGEEQRSAIRAFAQQQGDVLHKLLANGGVHFELPNVPHEEFEEHPAALELSGMFFEDTIPYTYEEYTEHLQELERWVGESKGNTLTIDGSLPFRNVQISICRNKHVLVSKATGPAVHFVIEHPAMVTAFERFVAPVRE